MRCDELRFDSDRCKELVRVGRYNKVRECLISFNAEVENNILYERHKIQQIQQKKIKVVNKVVNKVVKILEAL